VRDDVDGVCFAHVFSCYWQPIRKGPTGKKERKQERKDPTENGHTRTEKRQVYLFLRLLFLMGLLCHPSVFEFLWFSLSVGIFLESSEFTRTISYGSLG
jgi:hypothetical protein